MVSNGKLATDTLTSLLNVKLSTPTANALKNAMKHSPWTITIPLPGGGYRDWAMQNAMYLASIGNSIAEKQKWNLSLTSKVRLSQPGGSSHGWGTRVDLKFNGSDNPTQAQIDYMKKYGFTREFGADDRNHFMHDGKTAIKLETGVTIEGVDYSYARPTAKQLKDAGKHFAVRYVTVPGKGNKGIDQAEYDALHAAGIAVVAVFELNAQDMKKGKAQGISDAKAAQAGLKRIVGLSDNLPVYFTVDWDATPADQTPINAYLDGAASVLGRNRVGIYGGYYPVKRAKDAKKATWFWQTLAWSGGQIVDGVHLYQYKVDTPLGSGSVDLVRAYKTEYGQHAPATAAPATPVVVKPPVVITPTPPTVPVVTVPPVDLPAQEADAEADNADFDPTKFTGTYYFKGNLKGEIYVYEPITGKKRHVSPEEWAIVKGYGHATVYTIPQVQADAIGA